MNLVYIGVGSNLGHRYENLNRAQQMLDERGIRIRRVSPFYETEAVVKSGQGTMPQFLNGVFQAETDLKPEALLDQLEKVEQELGRKKKGDWNPRPIDLDLLFYGDAVLQTDRLKVPHPEIINRWFVLKPLADIAADLIHPLYQKKVRDLLEERWR